MYQRIGEAAYKVDLSNALKLTSYLGDPHHGFRSIHVAGTNGKGSTSHMLASIFQEAGYKTGLYTSPHLKDFRERIKVNGKMISKKEITSFVGQHQPFFEENRLSFFEMTVGLAFDHFRKEQVDIAIIEVGLGGRLDSTNVIEPELSIITNIGLDHTRFLGNTLPEIAREKAGIIKPKIPVVIGESHSETKNIFIDIADRSNSQIVFSDKEEIRSYETDLKGNYQKKNVNTVVAAIDIMRKRGWNIPDKALVDGFARTVDNTGLLGRWQILNNSPKAICDIAHNAEGIKEVMSQLKDESFEELHFVLGFVNDKDIDKVLPLFPKEATYYFCKPDIERGLDVHDLKLRSLDHSLNGKAYNTVYEAYRAAIETASFNDVVYVGGSAFVVSELL